MYLTLKLYNDKKAQFQFLNKSLIATAILIRL